MVGKDGGFFVGDGVRVVDKLRNSLYDGLPSADQRPVMRPEAMEDDLYRCDNTQPAPFSGGLPTTKPTMEQGQERPPQRQP